MNSLILLLAGILIGLLLFPLVMFARARQSNAWDNSNMLNMYRVIARIATRPGDLSNLSFPDGTKPFWYTSKDETVVVPDKKAE